MVRRRKAPKLLGVRFELLDSRGIGICPCSSSFCTLQIRYLYRCCCFESLLLDQGEYLSELPEHAWIILGRNNDCLDRSTSSQIDKRFCAAGAYFFNPYDSFKKCFRCMLFATGFRYRHNLLPATETLMHPRLHSRLSKVRRV
jgi:hypothetical protein